MIHPFRNLARRGLLAAFGHVLVGNAILGAQGEPCDPNCLPCAVKESVNAMIPGLRWGADLRLRSEYLDDAKLNDQGDCAELWRQRFRARLWATAKATDSLSFTGRLTTEPWYYTRFDDAPDQWVRDEALIDQLYLDWKGDLGMPVRARVGRQDIRLGDGWLVRRGTPLDSSRTDFFDAVRTTVTLDDRGSDLDLIGLRNHANSSSLARPFGDDNLDLIEQDETGAIVYGRNRRFENVELDAYFIYKHNDKVLAKGNDADIYTFGVRVAGPWRERWTYTAELAPQFGQKNDTDLHALGFRGRLSYTMQDAWSSSLWLGYEYRSGDDDPDGAFDVLWGRYGESIANIFGPIGSLEGQTCHPSNFHLLRLGWTGQPTKAVSLNCDWSPMFAEENPNAGKAGFSDDGRFRGHLVTGTARYKINRHAETFVMCETFFPGNYYENPRDQAGTYLRWHLMLTW